MLKKWKNLARQQPRRAIMTGRLMDTSSRAGRHGPLRRCMEKDVVEEKSTNNLRGLLGCRSPGWHLSSLRSLHVPCPCLLAEPCILEQALLEYLLLFVGPQLLDDRRAIFLDAEPKKEINVTWFGGRKIRLRRRLETHVDAAALRRWLQQ